MHLMFRGPFEKRVMICEGWLCYLTKRNHFYSPIFQVISLNFCFMYVEKSFIVENINGKISVLLGYEEQ